MSEVYPVYANLLVGLLFLGVVAILVRRLGIGRMRPRALLQAEMERRQQELQRESERPSLKELAREELLPVAAALREMIAELPEAQRPVLLVEPDRLLVEFADGPLEVCYHFRTVVLDAGHAPIKGRGGEWLLRDARGEVAYTTLDSTVRMLARRIAGKVV